MNAFDSDILALERKYENQPLGQIVFYGSSSIRLWPSLSRAFPKVAIENWGFGGSQLSDCLTFFKQAILPRQPRGIVLYAGDNDLALGQTPAQVWESLRDLLDIHQEAMEQVPFAFLSLKPSPARVHLKSEIEECNEWCQREIASRSFGVWVDVFSPMLASQSQWGRRALFMNDELHLSRAGYDVWNEVLKRDLDWLG